VRRPVFSALLFVGLASLLEAQRGARLEVSVPAVLQPPQVRAIGVLGDKEMRSLLENGFPARLHYRVELWSVGGWFNDLEGSTEWDVVVQFDAFSKSYGARRVIAGQSVSLGTFPDFAAVAGVLAAAYRAPVPVPTRRGKYYYSVGLDVETLSMSDLDEVERWLRGELRPAVRGERNPGTALTRGLRTLFVRLLGGERRRYDVQSRTFNIE
jgi:hypothetical protein